MPRTKSNKLAPFQKVLTVMISGKPITIEEFDTLLGKEIYMYRISTYMWHIKSYAGGVVKSIKDGRKVTAYQLMNVDEVKKYLDNLNVGAYVPGSTQKKPSISKLADLKAKAVKPPKKTKTKTEPAVEQPVAEVPEASDEMVITEVTE